MADAKQVQIRRDTAANMALVTPALAELAYDITNKSLRLGDGATAGGIFVPNYIAIQEQRLISGTVGGTADAITLTLPISPSAYVQYQSFAFVAASTNTGPVTININGVGLEDVRKMAGGSIGDLDAGDIVAGGVYRITHDGTQFQLEGGSGAGGSGSVVQGDLNTSVGSISVSGSFVRATISGDPPNNNTYATRIAFETSANVSTGSVLPGGEYGFYPQVKRSSTNYSAQQRYINSSPPFDLGDGEVGGFFFALVDENGTIQSTYIADTPPWGYNGPTKIKCDYKCPVSGKKYRNIIKKRSLEEIMDGASIKYERQEITHNIKNADMHLIPHPFGDVPAGRRVVLLDPQDDRIRRLIEYQNAGGEDIYDMVAAGKFQIDNTAQNRKCPKGVSIHKFKYKYAKKG